MTWPKYHRLQLERLFPRVDAGLFAPARDGHGQGYDHWSRPRMRCLVCDAVGYDGCDWMAPHRRGHSRCPLCPKMLTVLLDGSPRRHTRCPGRDWSRQEVKA